MRYDVDKLTAGVLAGDRSAIGQSITLVESQNERHFELAQELVTRLMPQQHPSRRIGISGVPGVGKSTFIENYGKYLVDQGRRLAVLAVDPSSETTGGSILGDKTRMVELARHPLAFIRPSATGGFLGGVTRRTRETLIILEAAGYEDIIVETVGVGQSEVQVAKLVDCFLVLMLPTAGDELQGIKRGILELAHGILINKCDIDPKQTRYAEREYRNAFHYGRGEKADSWQPEVISCSGQTGEGFPAIDKLLLAFFDAGRKAQITRTRADQDQQWFMDHLHAEIVRLILARSDIQAALAAARDDMAKGGSPAKALKRVLALVAP